MGDCVYLRAPSRTSIMDDPEMRVLKSHEWGSPAKAVEVLAEKHFLNTPPRRSVAPRWPRSSTSPTRTGSR